MEKKHSSFKIVYGWTLLDLISLLIDEMVRLDDNRKTLVIKKLLKNVWQYVQKKKRYAFQANKR